MLTTQHPSPYAYAREALPTDDPDGEAIFPDEETYFRDPNRPAITFTQDLTLKVGGHTFELLFTPGHTVGQIAVHVPEERVVFTGDTIFCECQTWLYVSNVDQWLAALDRIRALDVDHVVPGHGPVTTKAYVDVQRAFLLEWVTAVAVGVAQGWTKEECIARISFADRFPVDIGQEYMMGHIQRENVAALYDKLSRRRAPLTRATVRRGPPGPQPRRRRRRGRRACRPGDRVAGHRLACSTPRRRAARPPQERTEMSPGSTAPSLLPKARKLRIAAVLLRRLPAAGPDAHLHRPLHEGPRGADRVLHLGGRLPGRGDVARATWWDPSWAAASTAASPATGSWPPRCWAWPC